MIVKTEKLKIKKMLKNIRCIIYSLFLAASSVILSYSNNANAEYQYIYQSKDKASYFMDTTSKVVNGSYIKIWIFEKYQTPTPTNEMSVKTFDEFNCDKKMWRCLNYISYTDANFTGNIRGHLKNRNPKWKMVQSPSIVENIMNNVCKLES